MQALGYGKLPAPLRWVVRHQPIHLSNFLAHFPPRCLVRFMVADWSTLPPAPMRNLVVPHPHSTLNPAIPTDLLVLQCWKISRAVWLLVRIPSFFIRLINYGTSTFYTSKYPRSQRYYSSQTISLPVASTQAPIGPFALSSGREGSVQSSS